MDLKFDKQGHRGCRGLMPENTIPAFLRAIELGVTTLEMDTVITKDKKVLVSHEPFFNHEITTQPNGNYIPEEEERLFNIFKMTYADTLSFDVGLKPHPRFPQQQKINANKPLLTDVFSQVKAYLKAHQKPPVFFNIETKCLPETDHVFHPEPREFVELLMEEIHQAGAEPYVTIQSFDIRTLKYLNEYYSQSKAKTSLLTEPDNPCSLQAHIDNLGFVPDIYSPEYTTVNELLIEQCHDLNIKIIPWTVNDKQTMELLKNAGVDGVISDYPNLF